MKFIQLPQLDVRDIRGAGVHRTAIEYCDYAVGGLVRARCPRTGKVLNMCIPASEGCRNCYASAITARFHPGRDYSAQNAQAVEWFFDEAAAKSVLNFRPKGPYKNGRTRPAVFLGDMTDPFGPWVTDAWLDRMMAVCALRPDVDFLILMKRPERAAEYLNREGALESRHDEVRAINRSGMRRGKGCTPWAVFDTDVALPNVWLGTSVEDQPTANARIRHLLKCPAAVRFLSVEPLLAAIDLRGQALTAALYAQVQKRYPCDEARVPAHLQYNGPPSVDWVIVGGESGRGARACDVGWIRGVRDQCQAAGVPVFVKQLGADPIRNSELGGFDFGAMKDPKGGDMAEWPEDLRVREMPKGVPA